MKDHITQKVESSSARTPGSLPKVQSRQKYGVTTEDNGFAGHVDTKRQCAGGDDDSKIALAEVYFNGLSVLHRQLAFDYHQQYKMNSTYLPVHTSMMNTDASSKSIDQALANFPPS